MDELQLLPLFSIFVASDLYSYEHAGSLVPYSVQNHTDVALIWVRLVEWKLDHLGACRTPVRAPHKV